MIHFFICSFNDSTDQLLI